MFLGSITVPLFQHRRIPHLHSQDSINSRTLELIFNSPTFLSIWPFPFSPLLINRAWRSFSNFFPRHDATTSPLRMSGVAESTDWPRDSMNERRMLLWWPTYLHSMQSLSLSLSLSLVYTIVIRAIRVLCLCAKTVKIGILSALQSFSFTLYKKSYHKTLLLRSRERERERERVEIFI